MTNDLPPMPNTPPLPTSKPTGKKRRNLITAAAAALALTIGGIAYWISQPSYDDIVKGCEKALAAQYKAGGKGKPSACNDVKSDDYDTLVLNAAMGDLGWLDDDGNFDENKMLDDATP
jgi:hypothetical protein